MPDKRQENRCEMCELLASAHATGVEQLLQASMWVDRAVRFGEPASVAEAVAKVDSLRPEVEKAWANLAEHRSSDHRGSH